MKYMLFLLLLSLFLIAGCGGKVSLTTPPAINISITNKCTDLAPCDSFQVYRITGSCPADLNINSGWVLIDTLPVTTTIYTDMNVTSGQTYSYDIEGARESPDTSGPSNCISRSI